MINLFKPGFFMTHQKINPCKCVLRMTENNVNVTNTKLQNGVEILRQCLLHVLG